MPKKNPDETLADSPAEQVVDESLGDVETPELKPEDFDFKEWLSGLGPLTATYSIPHGPTFKIQARTRDFLRESGLILEDGQEPDENYATRLLEAHIVEPAGVTAEELRQLGDTPGYFPYIKEMALIATNIGHRPNLINPHFLRGASD